MKTIASSHNEFYKAVKALRTKKARTQQGLFLIEGVRLVRHALGRGWPLRDVILDLRETGRAEIEALISEAEARGVRVTGLDADLFDALAETVHTQGCLAVAEMPETAPRPLKGSLFLALDQIRDPGNLGTILRTADAAGVSGVYLSKGCVEPFNDKVVRATMGSLFDIPMILTESLQETLALKRQEGFEIAAAVLEDSVDYTLVSLDKPVVLVVGNEAEGISDPVLAEATLRISIPIRGGAESLNAAVAAAVLTYEAVRQRKVRSLGR
jgi:TrmH family RNA methyltransferase